MYGSFAGAFVDRRLPVSHLDEPPVNARTYCYLR
jgi:hypothetical protein